VTVQDPAIHDRTKYRIPSTDRIFVYVAVHIPIGGILWYVTETIVVLANQWAIEEEPDYYTSSSRRTTRSTHNLG
jgi:hypothetical protein